MNKITIFLSIIILALCFNLAATRSGRAQDQQGFRGVIPFVTSSDRVGFFDQNTGKVYMYDSSIHQCLFIGQLQTLGQPIQAVSATATPNQ